MRVGLGSDHAAHEMKLEIKAYLEAAGHTVVDYGHHSAERADYPVYGRLVAEAVVAGDVDRGLVMCGTGVGISIAANKVRGVRCVCCSEPFSARLSRQHNDTNMLALGARVVGIDLAKMIVDEWLAGEFEGGRHADRIGIIARHEQNAPSPGHQVAGRPQ